MPTYDYRCEHCGKFQISQRITEPALETCPTCSGKVKRIISKNVGVMFKGKGFYCKDHSDCLTPTPSGRDDYGADTNESAEKDYYVVDDSSAKEPAKAEAAGDKQTGGDRNKDSAAKASA